jgi:transposase InsO family protein
MIAAEKAEHHVPVSLACSLLGVSRSGYSDWVARAPSDRALGDAWLIEKIRAIHDENRKVYGAPRIHAELRMQYGIRVGAREQLSRVVDSAMKNDQAATLSSVIPSSWLSSSVTLMPSLNFTPSSTSPTSSWPLKRRQRSWAASSSL